MRSALQRLLADCSILRVIHNAPNSEITPACNYKQSEAFNETNKNDGLERAEETRQSFRFVGPFRRQRRIVKLQKFQSKQSQARESRSSETSTTKTERIRSARKDWRSRLASFEQYKYESDFSKGSNGALLVDDGFYTNDSKLWLELLQFRQRHHGAEGVKPIFERIVQKGLHLETEGPVAQALWYIFSEVGAQDTAFLEQVVRYASKLLRETGRSWTRLYLTVMSRMMRHGLSMAMYWHTRLKEDFPPVLDDFQKLFYISMESKMENIFAKMYADAPVPSMYASIVPKLCGARMYAEAFRWHFELLKAQDFPLDFSDIEPLLAHYAQLKDDHRVEVLAISTLERSTKMKAPLRKFVSDSKVISRELMNRRLGEIHGIAPKYISDQFCARLFATKIFSVRNIINGLEVFGAQSIGNLSLRELVSRDDCKCDAVCQHLDLLRKAGIRLSTSKYTTVIRQAAQSNKRWLLQSIIDCDAHPDTFGDLNLQEKLFAMYLNRGDTIQMERTLATITSEVPEKFLEMQRLNFILRGHIRLRNRDKVISMFEKMKAMNIPLTPKSSRHLRVHWLSRRRVSKTGLDLAPKNLTLLINVMRQTLEAGGTLPPEAWREILRRLGMFGRLTEFQSLALSLADWYGNLPPPADSSTTVTRSFDRLAEQKKLGANAILPSQRQLPPGSLPTIPQLSPALTNGAAISPPLSDKPMKMSRAEHGKHLNTIFTKSSQQAIIAWGFQEEAKRPQGLQRNLHRPGYRPNWTWGLSLLRQLRERGVPIYKASVAKACKQRLAQLFDMTWRSKRSVNRTARRLNERRRKIGEPRAQYDAYVLEMRSIWGEDLFARSGKFLPHRHIEVHSQSSSKRRSWKIVGTEA